jgi:RluA family pseudouridine synthase
VQDYVDGIVLEVFSLHEVRKKMSGQTTNRLPPIVFEDAWIVAFDKPSSLLTSPDGSEQEAMNLMAMVRRQMSRDICNVHRLDKETSGVVVCAKDKKSLDSLCGQFQSHNIVMRHLALIGGTLGQDETSIALNIDSCPDAPDRMRTVKHGGKTAQTSFHVLTRWRGWSLVEAFAPQLRVHQVRVHLQASGHPIVGDKLYGDGRGILLSQIKRSYKQKAAEEMPLIRRLALHAESVTFKHPQSGAPTTIGVPLPDDFNVVIKYLKRFAGL